MRLHPPVPSGTQRVTPPEGMWIGERFVPGDTIVQVPSYTVFRDARAFEQPGEFIPERWTTMPELVRDRSVYIPFNTGAFDDTPEEQTGFGGAPLPWIRLTRSAKNQGPYACVGKRLAMLELRRVVAEILWRYDVAVAPGQTKEAFLDGKQDTFTTVSAPLPIIFTERVRSE